MADALKIARNEVGVVRLFQVDISHSDLDRIQNPKPDMPPTAAAIADLVGLDWIETDYAELFDVQDLEGLGLADYLVQGLGVADSDLADVRTTLEHVEGIVLILYSRAFDGDELTINPRRALQLLGVFQEAGTDITFKNLPSAAASEPSNLGAPPTHPHLNVIKAMFILPAICLVVGLLIWLLFL